MEPICLPVRLNHVDETEREAIRAEGLDPDDPAVIEALEFVSWELSMYGRWRL